MLACYTIEITIIDVVICCMHWHPLVAHLLMTFISSMITILVHVHFFYFDVLSKYSMFDEIRLRCSYFDNDDRMPYD